MRTAFVSVLALATTFVNVLSAPVESASLVKRQSVDPTDIITSLTITVEGLDAQINSTLATITPDSSSDDIAAATTTIQGFVNSITDAVNAATAEVPTASNSTVAKMIKARQTGATDPTALGLLIEGLLVEISNTLNGVIAGLGLTPTLGIAQPLTLALSNLLLALDVVVDDLLVIVRQLVDGLLIGLSAALAGLIL